MKTNTARRWAVLRQLWTLAQYVRRGQAASPHNPVNMQLLALAAEREQLRPHDVVSLLEITAPSATRYVQALEQAGQVDVVPDPADGRTYLIQITDIGRDALATVREELLETMQPVFDGFTAAELDTLLDLLGRLTTTMGEQYRSRPALRPRKNRWRETT